MSTHPATFDSTATPRPTTTDSTATRPGADRRSGSPAARCQAQFETRATGRLHNLADEENWYAMDDESA